MYLNVYKLRDYPQILRFSEFPSV